ncbi:hypothetical protein [Leifsonia shinshuensis]|uniref:Uncharacterized protein n=1 Tax=Leifsonia shinshuensis TaxID=150026 RepID=A0A7G6YCP3_9MICO|nr:hypothetical protein [Leifsonia shinshuensis]QNE36258.1 hypothetical protein F1C12_14820 [Leifsonia shinshuensis]
MPDDGGWAEALDALEARAAQAAGPEALEPWRPDAPLPALPAALAERAREVQAAQQRAIDGLRDQQERIRAELESLGTVQTPRTDAEPPVYLDLIG